MSPRKTPSGARGKLFDILSENHGHTQTALAIDANRADPEERLSTIFLGVPTPSDSPAEREAMELLVDAVRRDCQRAAPDGLPVRVISGRQVASNDPRTIREALRRIFREEADALIVLRASSFGCGREVEFASHLDIPTLLLSPKNDRLSVHAGGTPLEGAVDVRTYSSIAELEDVIRAWLYQRRAMIEAGHMRRTRPRTLTEPLRTTLRKQWQQAGPEERRRIADALLTEESRLTALLDDPSAFAAASTALTSDLAGQLDVERAQPAIRKREAASRREATRGREEVTRRRVPPLPDYAYKGLFEAKEMFGWSQREFLRAHELGVQKWGHDCEVAAAGGVQRKSSLGNRFTWKRLLDEDAKAAS